MKIVKPLYFLILFLALPFFTQATHIVGGEIYYDYLGNNNYKITLKVYRDCLNGQASFDNPAIVGVFDSNGNLVNSLSMALPGTTVLPITLNNPCYSPPANVCVEEAIYTAVINLGPLAGGYCLAYQRCCRNNTIINLINPGNVGSTYMTYIPDPGIASINNASRFKNFPPIFLCAGLPFEFDHSATDPDGDSLAYELCDPLDGADANNPQPNPPSAPPYSFIPFDASQGYSGSNPMNALPALTIDPITGKMTATPTMIGQWVVGVCAKEYRNGVLLSTNKRDFQFNVTNCPNVTVASVPSQQTFCFGFTVNFLNNSANASTYHWDFGEPLLNNDTSGFLAPQWTYNAPGTYTVMLVANPGLTCADTSYTIFKIDPLLQPSFQSPTAQCMENNSYNFSAAGVFGASGAFRWDFGAANPSVSNDQNPQGVNFSKAGVHTVTLTISENGCTRHFQNKIEVYPMAVADFEMEPMRGCNPFKVEFKDTTNNPMNIVSYNWNFGDGSSSSATSPIHVYGMVGRYNLSLDVIATNKYGCNKAYHFDKPDAIRVNPVPLAGISADPLVASVFNPEITFTDLSNGGNACFLYFGDGNSYYDCNYGSYVHSYSQYGNYKARQIVVNEFGCSDTSYINIEIKPEYRCFIPDAFTLNNDGLNDIFMPKVMGVKDYNFEIFNRWGHKIFETHDLNKGWNGTYRGEICKQDVYVYKITYTDLVDSKPYSLAGKVTLLR